MDEEILFSIGVMLAGTLIACKVAVLIYVLHMTGKTKAVVSVKKIS